jgi:hypothetical protein
MLTGDKRLAKQGMRACQSFATDDEITNDQGAVMETLVVSIMHLCDQEGVDPYEFMRNCMQKFYETLVDEEEDQ